MYLAVRVTKAGDRLETFQRGISTGGSGTSELLFDTRVRPSGREMKRPLVLVPAFVLLSVGIREAVLGEWSGSGQVISGRRKSL